MRLGAASSIYKDELYGDATQTIALCSLYDNKQVAMQQSEKSMVKYKKEPISDKRVNISICPQMTLTLLHSMLMLMMHVRKPSLIFTANFQINYITVVEWNRAWILIHCQRQFVLDVAISIATCC